jgi:predicted small metal-binding protein
MPYRLACAKLMPGCDFKAEAATQDELLEKAAAHAAEAHEINEITPDLVIKVKSIIERV